MHLRKKNPDGFFRFNEISLEYDMKSLNNLSDFVQITYPFELSLTFAGKFLKNTRSTGSLKIDKAINFIIIERIYYYHLILTV